MKKGIIGIILAMGILFIPTNVTYAACLPGDPGYPNCSTVYSAPKECDEYNSIDPALHDQTTATKRANALAKCNAAKYAEESLPKCVENCSGILGTACSQQLCRAKCKKEAVDKISSSKIKNRWTDATSLTKEEKRALETGCNTKKLEEYDAKNDSGSGEESVNFWDSLFNKNATYDKCGLGSQIGLSDRLLALLVKIYKTITTLAAVIVIVLGMLDFLKATSSDDADAMKKAGQKFMKRFMTVILLVMLPYLLEFILGTFGNERMKTCVSQFR